MAKDQANRNTKESPSDHVNRGMLNDAVDTILEGMDNLFLRFKEEVNSAKTEILKNRRELQGLRNDFAGLKEEFSNTPTRAEFEELKSKVNRFHPNN